MPIQYAADFETNVSEKDCRVWAYALSEIGNPNNFIYGNSLDDFMEWCANPVFNYELYFHNLKFDGEYIIAWLFANGFEYVEDKKDRRDNTFTVLITETGAFYCMDIFFHVDRKRKQVNKVTIRDSLKILNFAVEKIAKDFGLPLQKLDLDYKTLRPVGHQLTQHEIEYIHNDVTIMSMALNIMFENNLDKMTIASNALNDFKRMLGKEAWNRFFPVLNNDLDGILRKSYKGGFTYLNPTWVDKITGKGIVFDVNSMYPAKMKQELLPFGNPLEYEGEYEYDSMYPLFIQQLSCKFEIKPNKIPSIQIKSSYSFRQNEYLLSSNGETVILTLTSPDLELFKSQYNITDLEYLRGWKFHGMRGIFTKYVDHWTEEKIKAKKEGNKSMYTISKLMLNSLYGKFGTNPNGRRKSPMIGHNDAVQYLPGEKEERKSVYIPVASFITAYARKYIIESSQFIREYSQKKYGQDLYVYSDTDSIHCLLTPEDVEELSKVLVIDDYELGAWKLESTFTRGKYLHQKCYIEESPEGELNVTVAGLPKKLGFLVNFDNFKVGFSTADFTNEQIGSVGRKLTYKHVKGGVLLVDTDFTIK